jgi:hypothetical protein
LEYWNNYERQKKVEKYKIFYMNTEKNNHVLKKENGVVEKMEFF